MGPTSSEQIKQHNSLAKSQPTGAAGQPLGPANWPQAVGQPSRQVIQPPPPPCSDKLTGSFPPAKRPTRKQMDSLDAPNDSGFASAAAGQRTPMDPPSGECALSLP